MNLLQKVIDFIIAIVIIFIIPIMFFGIKKDELVQIDVDSCTNRLVGSVTANGFITRAMYERYLSDLTKTDRLYNIELSHEQVAYEPEYKLRTSAEVIDDDEGLWTGSNEYQAGEVFTELPDIHDPVYEGTLNTETNESVLAKAVDSPADPGHKHTEDCYLGHRHSDGCFINQNISAYAVNTYDNVEWGLLKYHIERYAFYSSSSEPHIFWLSYTYTFNGVDGGIPIEATNTIGITTSSGEHLSVGRYLISRTYIEGYEPFTCVDIGGVNPYTVYIKRNPVYDELYNNYNNWLTYNEMKHHFDDNEDEVTFRPINNYRISDYFGFVVGKKESNLQCGQIQSGATDCSEKVVSVAPTHPIQTVAIGDPLITTVIATYLDGSKRTVVASTDFSTLNIVQNQTAILTYDYYIYDTLYSVTTTVNVTVVPRNKTCTNGHVYNLSPDGTDPGCPYCYGWLRSLAIFTPSSGRLTMYRKSEGSLITEGVGLIAIYLDGHTEYVYNGYVDNLDPDYVGNQTVTIGYKGLTTTLNVTVIRNKKLCDVCGLYYNLYMDDTDPGCPYCKAKVPVFTGNIMEYTAATFDNEILNALYEGDGIYYFRSGDIFTIKARSKDGTNGWRLLGGLFGLKVRVSSSDTVKTEAVHN